MKQKRRLFAEYYVGECKGNGHEAAIRAGYSPTAARQTAYKLLRDPDVKAYIRQLNAEIVTANVATIQEIQEFWTKILRDEEEATKNRVRASELLAKAKGMFADNW